PGLPDVASPVLSRALAFEPKNRYQNAKQFSEELANALLDYEKRNSAVPRRWPPLKKSLAVVGAALVLALLSFGIYKYINRPIRTEPSKNFKYWLMVQQMRDGKEYQAPYK